MYPAIFRKVDPEYPRDSIRIPTRDMDFLDIDLYSTRSDQAVILCHGLEGSSKRAYVLGMAKQFISSGYDVVAWNYRCCGSGINVQPRLYHSGATEDLEDVVEHFRASYKKIYLIGFSLGGNLILKFLGEKKRHHIHGSVAFSVPLDLRSSAFEIGKRKNWIYEKRFLNYLFDKIRKKHQQFPNVFNPVHLKKIKNIIDYDDIYTAPIHGFKNALEYYEQCSSRNFVDEISTPTLIINALNDPFLPKECYRLNTRNDQIIFETPFRGGHCGFSTNKGPYWSEIRAHHFIGSLA